MRPSPHHRANFCHKKTGVGKGCEVILISSFKIRRSRFGGTQLSSQHLRGAGKKATMSLWPAWDT